MVLRFKGTMAEYQENGRLSGADTVTNEAVPTATIYVHKNEDSLAPILRFDNTKIDSVAFSDHYSLTLMELHNAVGKLVDALLKTEVRTENPATTIEPTMEELDLSGPIVYKMPGVRDPFTLPATAYTMDLPFCSRKTCTICKESLQGSKMGIPVGLVGCGHAFHWRCLKASSGCPPECNTCRKPLLSAVMKGKMPSGTMTVSSKSHSFQDGDEEDILEILYSFKPGVQRPYHNNPGKLFDGTEFSAFLPGNDEGKRLLSRLKRAFAQGLTFDVVDDTISWAEIPHCSSLDEYETSLRFFSARFLDHVHTALDQMNVQGAPAKVRADVVYSATKRLPNATSVENKATSASKKKYITPAGAYIPLHSQFGRYIPVRCPSLKAVSKNLASKSTLARAWEFVEVTLAIHSRLASSDPSVATFIQPLAADDMVAIAEAFIKTQAEFKRRKPSGQGKVDLAYHYTQYVRTHPCFCCCLSLFTN